MAAEQRNYGKHSLLEVRGQGYRVRLLAEPLIILPHEGTFLVTNKATGSHVKRGLVVVTMDREKLGVKVAITRATSGVLLLASSHG